MLNRIPHKETHKIQYEIWKEHKANSNYFRVRGCLAHVKIVEPRKTKFGTQASSCMFIGCSLNSPTYRFLDIGRNIIFESSDAIFHENKFPSKSKNGEGQYIDKTILPRPNSSTSSNFIVKMDCE